MSQGGREAPRDATQRPVLFVTGHAPPYRHEGLALLHEMQGIELALFGGRMLHGPRGTEEVLHPPPVPHLRVREQDLLRIAASGRHRAVVCSTGGRVALPMTWAGARLRGAPLILWASLWAHPRSVAHAFSWLPLRRLYRSAEAVVTYGPHVSAYVTRRGAENVHVAPQAVDNDFWAGGEVKPPSHPSWPVEAGVRFLFAGRPGREKGCGVLLEAWRVSGLRAPSAALVLVGVGSAPPWVPADGAVRRTGAASGLAPVAGDLGSAAGVALIPPVPPEELRNFYAFSDVLVVPSIPTPTFREPWGLVVNEAMNRRMPVIATDAVGAAAGGLLVDGRNGLVVPAGDAAALAGAMSRLAGDPALRLRLGARGAEDVRSHSARAWAEGFSDALRSLHLARERW